MKTLQQADRSALAEILQLIEEARAFLKHQGFDQWQHGYPAATDIENDMELQQAYILQIDGRIAAYCAVIRGEEPAYSKITGGRWGNDSRDYVTVHRIAMADCFRGQGLMPFLWAEIYQLADSWSCPDVRVDTHPENGIMQKTLIREGFIRRGIVKFEGLRIAYQKEWIK
jgi:GNAT superfamily N-acetyltransferase